MNDENNQDHRLNKLYFVISFLAVFIISFLVLFFIEKEVRVAKIMELQLQEKRVVNLENDFLGREFSMVLSDLHYLHQAYEKDLFDSKHLVAVSDNWSKFSSQRRIYDQIRFIDASGDEKIRINIGSDGGYAVPEKDLQNKSDRYYFTETIKLKEGSVYVSPLDLNVEHGEVEIPYKPMIRISTPLYDDMGTFKGIIILNYLADYMLTGFREAATNSQGEIILLNAAGYRLSSFNPNMDWNFMFEEKKGDTFEKEYSNEWRNILKSEGQQTTENGLITAVPVGLNQKYAIGEIKSHNQPIAFGDGSWYVVSVIKRTPTNSGFFNDNIWSLLGDVLKKNGFYFLLVIVISSLVGFLVYVNRKTYSSIKFYSECDPLTKTLNRRAGIARLNELFPSDERRHFLVSLCFLDINGLKEVNDTIGHKFGDELIISVANVIKETIRDNDFLIRLGGDEFLIVFNGIGVEMAEVIWERIVLKYNQINQNDNRPYNISVSHGVVDFENKQKTHVDELINAADEKMYEEKKIMKAGLNVIKECNQDQ